MADLNLVPYIDLLTCMISFLLITAVWTQLSMLKARQRGPGSSEEAVAETFALQVLVNRGGFVVVEGPDDHKVLPLAGDRLDFAALTHELEAMKRAHPDKTDVQVAPEDDIAFDQMIKTMDAALGAGFPDVALTDTSASPAI
jgi:biopolymer transport protein ExbD